MKKPYPVLMLGTDAALLDSLSDASARMRDYARLYSKIDIFVSARDQAGRLSIEIAPSVTVHPATSANKLMTILSIYHRARSFMRAHDVRCVIAQDPFAFGLTAFFLTRFGRGVFIVGLYGTDPTNRFFRSESIKHFLYATIARFVLRYADAIQTDGPETVDHLRAAYGDNVFFKPMFPANADVFSRIERVVPITPFRLLFVGRFVPQKNLPLLVDTIHALKKSLKNGVHVTLVGDGPLKTWFMNELVYRGCVDICDDVGRVSRDDIPKLYATHHAFILTSYYEGFPRVFMEAALAGLPVVTTDVGGVKDLIIDDVSGYVMPQGSTGEDIVHKAVMLATDPVLLTSFSKNIKERWQTVYGGKTILDYQQPLVEYVGMKL